MAATDSPPAVADGDDDQRHIFPFFDLPQELRDEIYDLSLASHDTELRCGLNFTAEDVPTIELLLVSQDFSHEFQLRAKKKSRVTITDTGAWSQRTRTIIPPAVSNATSIMAQILCMEDEEIEAHGWWLRDLAQTLKHPLALSIRVTHDHPANEVDSAASIFRRWTAWKGLRSLKVYQRFDESETEDQLFDFAREDGLHWEWHCTSTTGELEDVSSKTELTKAGA